MFNIGTVARLGAAKGWRALRRHCTTYLSRGVRGSPEEQIQVQQELQTIPLVVMSGRKEEVTEKVPQLFESFEFLEKPFDQKTLIGAIKAAMAKAKKRQPLATPAKPVETVTAPISTGTNEIQLLKAEIKALNEKNVKMQAEVDGLKKQISQILAFIKQKK